jgi:hypothetical protein
MQRRTGVGAQANDVARVGRNLRLEKNDVEQLGAPASRNIYMRHPRRRGRRLAGTVIEGQVGEGRVADKMSAHQFTVRLVNSNRHALA